MAGFALPAGWSVRHPTLNDVSAILALANASDVAALGEPDWSTDEIVETLTAPNHDPARDSWLAVDPVGRVVGWAYLDNPAATPRDNVEVYVHPGLGEPAQAPLLHLAVARAAERARDRGYPETVLRAGVIASETAYVAVLKAAGFGFVKRHARMRRPLTGAEAIPEPPSGVTIRPLRHDDLAELRRFHHVLEQAFADTLDHLPTTYGAWSARVAALPSVSWDEWFVAVVDEGGTEEIVGVLQSSDQSVAQGDGFVKNLAVLREHRKRRIGAALLATAFATYAAKGRIGASLGVDLTNPTGAYPLYRSVGMNAVYEADAYELTVPAAP